MSRSLSDYDDTPACELVMLESKRYVERLLGDVIRFAELSYPSCATTATLTEVRRSLRGVDSEALDRLIGRR